MCASSSAQETAPLVVTPTTGVDPRVALATSMHAAPGVYAFLVGSGMSSSAGIPTGWKVVQDLIRRFAVAQGVNADDLGDSPEEWWQAQGRPRPRYDVLLSTLAPTDAARQALLARYFDPPADQGGPVQPTTGHEALAQLCASGRVRLILSTNFDRLIERALEDAGVRTQVVASPSAVKGMMPLVHARVTVIKLHGDYAMLGQRNTPEELASYPPAWRKLLAQVFGDFGLVVIGWSAEYDQALVNALTGSPSRRYPLYWTTHNGSLTEAAKQLIAFRNGAIIDTTGADEFLTDLSNRMHRLDRIAARRSRPTPLRMFYYAPEQNAPSGWAVLPLLQLRAVGTVGPIATEARANIRRRQREALVAVMERSPLTERLRRLAATPATSASGGAMPPEDVVVEPLDHWQPTPDAYQTGDQCSYRLGGDAAGGVSALLSVRLPTVMALGGSTNSAVFIIDVALSLRAPLELGSAAMILRDALRSALGALPETLDEVLPTGVEPNHAEVHICAASHDGHQQNRPNNLLDRLDLSSLGPPTRSVGPQLSFPAGLSGTLSDHEVTQLVIDAVEQIALDAGYLDPDAGIDRLRAQLGLPAQS